MSADEIKQLEQKLKTLRNKSNKGNSGHEKVDVLVKLARKFYYSNPEKMEKYAQRGLTLAQKLGYKKGIASSYTQIGYSFYRRCHYDQALEYFLKCVKSSEDSGYKHGIAEAYAGIASIRSEQGDCDRALDLQFRALRIYEEIGDKICASHLWMGIGHTYRAQGYYKKALDYLFKCLKFSEKSKNKTTVAKCCYSIGDIFREQRKIGRAVKYLNRCSEINELIGDKDGLAQSCQSMGLIFGEQGNYDEALEYFNKTLELYEDLNDNYCISVAYGNVGWAQAMLKRYDLALKNLLKGLQIARDNDIPRVESACYGELYDFFEKQRKFDQALHYYKKYHDIEQKLLNEKRGKQIAEMTAKYETEEKEKEAEIYRLKNVDLRREIKKRKKVQKQLKENQNRLEETVAERTSKLEKEIAERKKAGQTLLDNQKQLRSLAREISLIEEKQRRKFATFLHDDINQALALATFKLRTLQEMNKGRNVTKELSEVKAIIDRTAERTRTLAYEISPPILYELGLEAALEWLVRQFGEQYGVKCEFKDDGLKKPLTDEASIFLFQSVRELLSNTAKHAQAHSIEVSTIKDGSSMRITVADDGIGFASTKVERKIRKNEGLGLFNVRERLRNLGGRVEVQSRKGEGTTITLIAPLKRAARKKIKK